MLLAPSAPTMPRGAGSSIFVRGGGGILNRGGILKSNTPDTIMLSSLMDKLRILGFQDPRQIFGPTLY